MDSYVCFFIFSSNLVVWQSNCSSDSLFFHFNENNTSIFSKIVKNFAFFIVQKTLIS